MQGYREVVQQSWNEQCPLTNSFAVLDHKLKRLAKCLKSWARNYIGDIRKQMLVGQEIILRLDAAQEDRHLSVPERELRSCLKARQVGLAVINRIKARQRVRIKWLRLGDANTKYFHSRAAHRKQKNRIQSLATEDRIATSPVEMEEVVFEHMSNIVGTTLPCTQRFNWSQLGLPVPDLSELDAPFSLEELKTAVFDTPSDKAPGPDGFSAGFFKTSYNVVKDDLLRALNKFYDLNDPSFTCLNTAFYVLLPKNEAPSMMSHYRPISLIHVVAKLVSKILSARLQPR
jgi:hypothetical protein